jgi:glutamate---cysteine ligase / carboxylate-amine ligase
MDGITLGVEEEFQIVDRTSGELVPRSDELIPHARRHLGAQVSAELNRCQVETATVIHEDLAGLRAELRDLRAGLDEAAAEIGCAVLPVGTHPWSHWEDQHVADEQARFREMEDRYQRVARQQVICGCHVHVGIEDPDLVVAVMSRVRPWVPVLLALAANSPFWNGEDTGYDSYRLEIWARWPTCGMPPALEDRAGYDDVVHQLQAAGAIEDATHLYWHIRPSDRYPTLEFRATDVCLSVDDAVLVAALARGLTRSCLRAVRAGEPTPEVVPELLDAALWRAARYGLGEELVSPHTLEPAPADQVVEDLVTEVGPDLDELGDRDEVERLLAQVLDRGNGARRQRAANAAAGDLCDVFRAVHAEAAVAD